ncbi:MAG TPA: DUF3102 domain-containing protein [Sphingobium sp.]|nr:DUF3102 domain-containing protein [Sphingobium sp.]
MLLWAIEAGKELLEVKKGLAHGEFQAWCEANLTFTVRMAQNYMRLARNETGCAFDPNVGVKAALEAMADAKPSTTPTLTHDDAERIHKLAAMANSPNENEAGVAQEMLDKMAGLFGLTGEEAQAAAEKLCPEPPSHDELVRKADAFNAKLDERVAAIRTEMVSLIEREGRDEALTIIAETICRLKFPKEYRGA